MTSESEFLRDQHTRNLLSRKSRFSPVYAPRCGRANGPDYPTLTHQLGVTGYPTTVIISPDYQVLDIMKGHVDAHELRQRLSAAVHRHRVADAVSSIRHDDGLPREGRQGIRECAVRQSKAPQAATAYASQTATGKIVARRPDTKAKPISNGRAGPLIPTADQIRQQCDAIRRSQSKDKEIKRRNGLHPLDAFELMWD